MPAGDDFDAATRTWTLRSHVAVSAALANAALTIDATPPDAPRDASIRAAVRGAARDQFSAVRLAAWRESFTASAKALVDSLPFDAPVDLMNAIAEPWALSLALEATGGTRDHAARINALARTVFLDAAMTSSAPDSRAPANAAREATVALAAALARGPGEHPIDVQSFVAISQTLPHLLVAVWHALLTHADQVDVWRSTTNKFSAIDELLRYAGPSRAIFRWDRGERLTLMLGEANRDPLVFDEPDRLDLTRRNAGQHVALGGGLHACIGAPIIRLAVETATNALFERANQRVVIDEVQWLDGFALRAPSALVVRISAERRP
jgi:cytochrome P450